jgi:hypothetical protein
MHNKLQIICQVILIDLERKWRACGLLQEVQLIKRHQLTRWHIDK